MRKAPRGGRLREEAPAGGVEVNRTHAVSQTLGIGLPRDQGPDAKPRKILDGCPPDRSKLFGSHGQRPWV
jgi:hypothetical protein